MAGLTTPAKRRRPQFHTLTVAETERLTDDAVAVSFVIPPELREAFAFEPGQHLTLRATIDGDDVRRSYSICRSPADATARGELRVAAARVEAGVMSNWLNDAVAAGDEVQVMEPMGTFVTPQASGPRHHVAIAAGSGITPVMSLLTAALEGNEDDTATLIFGNRRTNSIMFLEELADLKNRYPQRFRLINVLSREAQDAELLSGRLDAARLRRILTSLVPVATGDEWYLCGPFGMVEAAQQVLGEFGVDTSHVHFEIFHVDEPGARPARRIIVEEGAPPQARVTVNLDGRSTVVDMPSVEETILDATLRARPDAPFSCTGGVCGTCRARVVAGEVRMDRNYALEPDEVAAGIVLACQSHPVSDQVTLDYDA
ncbi:ring-1,2-phenylacetyl-CoA epoxidase subunit PaaE [Kineosphaera limosa]|uniref:Phenylacetate-CoA oxygenase subunit PaaK n=1 Tax=Kineosphaera limosa NBRC 100340 TaxID=1184609 RepID=K6W526_9MICO|nr:1,2-phenylacetyl-CoA epoxidase subunit PaaE [Kineosphaera limosa]NYE02835.1 ring-1,2-phenylacetyl-CoA epoxidase subunit PaaE [Kineosphaera limosa]GAB94265.1 phenylacetate-CoA oxygenase subunit PaaK [Kineosphaera limosa NBRC 100340]